MYLIIHYVLDGKNINAEGQHRHLSIIYKETEFKKAHGVGFFATL